MRRLAFLAALLLAATPALARPVRVFVVNPHLRLPATYADYRDQMFALVDASHPRRAELVQDGLPDIAAQLRPRDPAAPADALIVFPEDVGLAAGLIGSRGEVARQVTASTGGSTVAFLALTVAYQPWVEYYGARYPGTPGLAGLFLGATDTWYRAFYETFRDIAVTYGVHVAASVNAAPARRVEAADDADLVARLRDPDEPQRTYAYEAVEGRPVNTLFVFAPDGRVLVGDGNGATVRSPDDTGGVLRGSFDKAYLTELEQDPLGLSFGAVRGLDALDTPVGRLAAVTSKDAWMVDVNDRYDAKRPQLVIQPEAFDQWAFTDAFWAPDGFKAGGFAQVQRNPSFLFNVTSCLVGNLFDVTFDGQGAVIGKRHKPVSSEQAAGLAWIGQSPDAGFVAVAPWVVDDPGGPDQAARRATLVASGRPLLPDSGVPCDPPLGPGSCEDGYRESIQRVDLDLPQPGALPPAREPGRREPTAFGTAAFVDAAAGEQRHPRVAVSGEDVYVVWQDTRDGGDTIYLAASRDGGAHFTSHRVSDHPPGTVVEWRPAVAYSPRAGLVHVAWQELCGGDDDCGRIVLARFDADGNKLGLDVRVDRGADDAGKWNVALAVDRVGNPLLAWVDERDRSPRGLPLEHIYLARSRDRGVSFGGNARVDRGAPTPFAAELDNKWAPTIAMRPPFIHVAWADFRNYQWDIYATRSRDGRFFDRSVRVDDGVSERIHDHPALAADARGTVHVAWADRQRQEPDTDIRYTRSTVGGRRFAASQRIDAGAPSANQWHPAMAVDGDDVVIAWQDNRLGDNDIFFARSHDRGATFAPDERLDDSGTERSEQTRPDVAIDPLTGTAWAVWEDDRMGPAAVAVGKMALE